MPDEKQRYRVKMTTTRGEFWMGRSLSDGVCGWVWGHAGASHYQMLSAAIKAAQQRWLDITSVFGDVIAIDVVNDQRELVWRGSREDLEGASHSRHITVRLGEEVRQQQARAEQAEHALAAMTQRAEQAEAKLALADDYARYVANAWKRGYVALCFVEWLAEQPQEVQP